ncbi:MAG: phosphodiester glycosidase family protein [Ferruginibacter sp.]
MKKVCFFFIALMLSTYGFCQLSWLEKNAAFAPLPPGFNVFFTNDSLDGKPNIAWYATVPIGDRRFSFTTDTTLRRRLTPLQFYAKNKQPLLVVNGTFFSFESNQNLNVVVKDGRTLAYNVQRIKNKAGDTAAYHNDRKVKGVFGISKKRKPDIAWVIADSSDRYPMAWQQIDSVNRNNLPNATVNFTGAKKWKMKTAIGGGPVLVQQGMVAVANEAERMFAGKAILDKHPRTLIGYTKSNELILMVIQGRTPGIAEGATLVQAAKIMIDLGCTEALNLDGGGSSCMLINGKQTITPSDKGVQRPVPAVFIVNHR